MKNTTRLSNQLSLLPKEAVLFAALLTVLLIPVFSFEYFPNWDGPAHVGGAAIAAQYEHAERSAFREYFLLNTRPSPNLLGHFLLILLQSFLAPVWSEKVLVALIILLFPFAFRYLVNTLNSDAKFLAYAAFPFAIGWFVYAGQYSFSLSLSIFLLALGYWFSHRTEMNVGKTVVLSTLLFILYFSHLVSYAMFFLFVFVLAFHNYAMRLADGQWRFSDGLSEFLQKLLPVFVASIPSVAMALVYFSSGSLDGAGNRHSFFDLVKAFGTLGSVLVVFDEKEYIFSILVSASVFALCFVAVSVNRARILKLSRLGFLVMSGLVIALYFLLPDALAGGSFLSPRLSLFAYIAVLCWLAQFDFKTIMQKTFVLSCIVAAVGLTIIRLPRISAFNRDISEFMSAAPHLRENATVLTLAYVYDGYYLAEEDHNGVTAFARRTRPMDFLGGYLMAELGVVDLGHYESSYDYFPTRYRAELDPAVFLGSHPDWMEFLPPAVDPQEYEQTSPGQVDYVLVWGWNLATEEIRFDPSTVLIREQLHENYRLIYTTQPGGLLQVYERNEVANP